MKEVKPTIFYGTPSYSLYIAEKAKEKGIDPVKDFNFRILFFSGEPGAGVPSTKKRIEETYGGIYIDSGSTAEMTPWMSNCECEYRKGMHLWQDIVYAEIVDPHTKKRVPYGKEGVVVYTHLECTSQPYLPTRCSGCGDIISLGYDCYSKKSDQYFCEICTQKEMENLYLGEK